MNKEEMKNQQESVDIKFKSADQPNYTIHHSNRSKIIVISLLIIALISLAIIATTTGNKKNNANKVSTLPAAMVQITSEGFVPSTIKIKVNQGVVWTNTDSKEHLVNSDPYPLDNTLRSFNIKNPIITSNMYTYVFNKAGTYTYHDDLNPFKFQGKVIVTN